MIHEDNLLRLLIPTLFHTKYSGRNDREPLVEDKVRIILRLDLLQPRIVLRKH
jgi:hypothetical protein